MLMIIAGTIGTCVMCSFSMSLQMSSVFGEVDITTLPPNENAPWIPGAASTMLCATGATASWTVYMLYPSSRLDSSAT